MIGGRGDFDPAAFWERRLERFDLSSVGFAGLGLRYNQWLYRVRSFVFRRALHEACLNVASARVLDIGSGTGFYIEQWLRAGATDVTGSDLTAASVARLGAAFPKLRFVQFDVTTPPPFPPADFDVVSAFDVLFHVVDDDRYAAAIANMAFLLRDGGYLFFSENFVRGSRTRHVHMVNRSRGEIEGLLAANGLEIVQRRPMFILMNSPIDSESRLLDWAWRGVRALVSRHEALGAAMGAILFPIEIALVSTFREGPSAELMVCRKRRVPAAPTA